MKKKKLKVGDWVEVKSKEEILKTLDQKGQTDGMPFMPEMFAFCGKRMRVYKRAHKTCDTVFPVRGRRVEGAVHLETRCDGSAHGGCQAGCLLFWKEEWFKAVGGDQPEKPRRAGQAMAPTEADIWMQTQTSAPGQIPVVYRCQATQLPYATKELNPWDISQYLEDYTSGNTSLWRILCGGVYSAYYALSQAGIGLGPLMRWFYDKFHFLWGGSLFPTKKGSIPKGQPTPKGTLDLRPGELVRVKSHQEILNTLDVDGKNRGMLWDSELVPYCGKTYRVLDKIARFIEEKTGLMQELKTPCVILESVTCSARYSTCRKFCPRGIYSWWREIWLERVEARPERAIANPEGALVQIEAENFTSK
jgi:hypothetical protein